MYLRTVYLDEKSKINELRNQYEDKIKTVNDDLSSCMKLLNPSSNSKKMDELRQLIKKLEDEKQGYYDIVYSLDYAIKCIDYVQTTKDLMYREKPSRDVWVKDGYDR